MLVLITSDVFPSVCDSLPNYLVFAAKITKQAFCLGSSYLRVLITSIFLYSDSRGLAEFAHGVLISYSVSSTTNQRGLKYIVIMVYLDYYLAQCWVYFPYY